MLKVLIENFNREIDRLSAVANRVPSAIERITDANLSINLLQDCIKLLNNDKQLMSDSSNEYLIKLHTYIKEYMDLVVSNVNKRLEGIIITSQESTP